MPEQNFLSTSEAAETSSSIPRWWWLLLGLALVTRMFVVAQDSIVPGEFDSFYYAQIAESYSSAGSPFSMLPLHRPGMSMLAGVVTAFGVPYKLFLDVLLGLAAILAGISFFHLTKSNWSSLLVAVLILWHPYLMFQSLVFMTEPLIAIVLLLLLISVIPFLCRPFSEWSISMALVSGVVASAFMLMRNEMLVLLGFFGVLLLLIIVRGWREFDFRIGKRKRSWRLILFFLPLFMAWSAERTVEAYHNDRFRVSAMCATEASGFKELMNTLYSIEPAARTRFVPVTQQSLELACQYSVVMEQRKSLLLDPARGAFHSAERHVGLQGEVGPWLNWHLIDCFGGVNRNSNQQMKVAAKQIRNAQFRGHLARRNARFPIDPLWQAWLPDLPHQFWESLLYSSSIKLNPTMLEKQTIRLPENSVAAGIFNSGLLRRAGTGCIGSLHITMKCSATESVATRVTLLTEDHQLIAEVPVKKGADGFPLANLSLSEMDNFDIWQPLHLRLLRETSGERSSELVDLPDTTRRLACDFQFVEESDVADKEVWGVSVKRQMPQQGLRDRVKIFLKDWRWLAICLLCAGTFIGGVCQPISRQRLQNLGAVVVLGACFVFGRSLFYSLIHVWLAWGAHRYVQPNILITLFTMAGFCFFLGSWLALRKQGRQIISLTETAEVPPPSNSQA